MEILDAIETEVRLPYPELADSIREVMQGRREGKLDAPSRLVLSLPERGNLLVMPAGDDELAITKLVTVHPGNARRELPTIQGEPVLPEEVPEGIFVAAVGLSIRRWLSLRRGWWEASAW